MGMIYGRDLSNEKDDDEKARREDAQNEISMLKRTRIDFAF
jgi:hypothetical protein